MSHQLSVKPQAIAQTAEIHADYQQIDQKLADRFSKELDACYGSIERDPTSWAIVKKNYRHARLKKFPYRVVYAVLDRDVVVFQVSHRKREPSKKFGP